MQPNRRSQSQAGFSLLEIIVVITLIGFIAAFAANQLFGQQDKAQWRLARTQMTQLEGSLNQYKLDTGKYPTSQEGLGALLKAPSGAINWIGPYVKNADSLKDPWKNDFIYRSPGSENRPFEMISLGADGKEGGDAVPNKDIKSWEN